MSATVTNPCIGTQLDNELLDKRYGTAERNQYANAEREVCGFFTSSLGVKAQSFEGGGGLVAFDANAAAERMLVSIRASGYGEGISPTAQHDRVAVTLAALPAATHALLALVYVPYGTGCSPRGARRGEDTPDLLSSALRTAWGGGSYVRLALTHKRVLAAFGRQHPGKTADPAGLLAFLTHEAGRGTAAPDWLGIVQGDGEERRTVALVAYDALRVLRMDAEAQESRERRAHKAAANAARLEEELGMDRRIARARFERRTRGRTAA
jgi:hypothetical protein